ncbi:MAG: hypothetical protein KTR15_06400 [Phycisphaeraceae bacterium]|nr:hypothetical protein [Phycisphaeraceae bacterium]
MPRPDYRGSRSSRDSRGPRGGRGGGGGRGRKPTDPMLMGEPSPALSKIAQMNTAKLRDYIKQISVNAEQLKVKIEKLQAAEVRDEKKIEELTTQRQRLAVLIKTAADRLQGKLERAKEYADGTRTPRGGGRGPRRY